MGILSGKAAQRDEDYRPPCQSQNLNWTPSTTAIFKLQTLK